MILFDDLLFYPSPVLVKKNCICIKNEIFKKGGEMSFKNLLLATTVCGAILLSAQPAFAVDDAEFEALKAQMQMFASKLQELEGTQSALEKRERSVKGAEHQIRSKKRCA